MNYEQRRVQVNQQLSTTFSYQRSALMRYATLFTARIKVMTLTHDQFIDCFVIHVLPDRCVRRVPRQPTQRHLVVPSEVPNLGGGTASDLDEIWEYKR